MQNISKIGIIFPNPNICIATRRLVNSFQLIFTIQRSVKRTLLYIVVHNI